MNRPDATAFSVAKAMQIDTLSDIKNTVEMAIKDRYSFEHKKILTADLHGKD